MAHEGGHNIEQVDSFIDTDTQTEFATSIYLDNLYYQE